MAKQLRAKRGSRRGLGSAVKPHIYRYGKKDRVEGLQARLKRTRAGTKPESISQYFSFERYGNKTVAQAAADRWLRKNKGWLQDRKFRPQPVKRPAKARKATRKAVLRVLRLSPRKQAKAA